MGGHGGGSSLGTLVLVLRSALRPDRTPVLCKIEEIFNRERQLASQANGHGILKYSLSPLENGAVVEGTRDGGRSALVIDNYACAALVCLCRDPPTAQTGALYFAHPLLALLYSRPAAWRPPHRPLQHIRCGWAVPYRCRSRIGQHGQVRYPGTATHRAGGVLLHACSAHGAAAQHTALHRQPMHF